MNRKLAMQVAVGAALSLAVAACGSSDGADVDPADAAAFMAKDCGGSTSAWTTLVKAAQKEGKVVTSGPPDPKSRDALPAEFNKRFGIDVDYLGGSSSELAAKLASERDAGVYSLDTFLGGANTAYTTMYENGWLDNLKAALVSDTILDPATWVGGKVPFKDPEGQSLLALASQVQSLLLINTDLVKEGEITSTDDLLDPKWKGKIVSDDPRRGSGTGANAGVQLYLQKGPDFVRDLYVGQDATLLTDVNQEADGVAKGRWAIGYPVDTALIDIVGMQKDGLPVASGTVGPGEEVVGNGYGILGLMDKAPHPNAAKLFANWLACPEGNAVWATSQNNSSLRTDVDIDVPEHTKLDPSKKYWDKYDWDLVTGGEFESSLAALTEIIGDK